MHFFTGIIQLHNFPKNLGFIQSLFSFDVYAYSVNNVHIHNMKHTIEPSQARKLRLLHIRHHELVNHDFTS